MINLNEYKEYFADCYVLSDDRSVEFIQSFLQKFVPNRKESANTYEVPQYSHDPAITFNTAENLINHLSIFKTEAHTIYWKNTDDSVLKGAMCFFTNDGHIILGLYCNTCYPNTIIEDKHFTDLKNFSKSRIGYITYEEPAPDNMADFLERKYLFEFEKDDSNPAQ